MMRLSQRELPSLRRTVRRPDVDRAALHTTIVHLGLGAFARAHLAAFTQPLLAADPFWGILGVSLRSPATRDALAPQDFLYTCAARDGSGISLAIMSVLTCILVAPESPAVVVAAMADPAVRIVSISVSERGYHRRAADGVLDEEDPPHSTGPSAAECAAHRAWADHRRSLCSAATTYPTTATRRACWSAASQKQAKGGLS